MKHNGVDAELNTDAMMQITQPLKIELDLFIEIAVVFYFLKYTDAQLDHVIERLQKVLGLEH